MLKSYLSDKIEKRESKIHGQGLFAKEDIKKNEVVFIKSGRILTREQLFSSNVINSYFPIDDNYFLGVDEESKEAEDDVKLFINHSCNPNCGIRGEITFVAMRDIAAGEELTIRWDGRDERGRNAPNGSYILALANNQGKIVAKGRLLLLD